MGVLAMILLLLATAAGCAPSSSVASPVTSAEDEVSESPENPGQDKSAVKDLSPESPEKIEPDEDDEPEGASEEEGKPEEHESENDDDEEPYISAEHSAIAGELGLIVLEEKVVAPVFVLSTLDGSEITLSDLRGKYVVVNFWTTHCPPCVAEMDYFEAMAKKYPDELTILAVDIRESESKVNDFFGGDEKTFTIPLDKTGEVASAYGIRYTPTTLFIDTEGNVPYAKIGAFSGQQQFGDSVALLMESA